MALTGLRLPLAALLLVACLLLASPASAGREEGDEVLVAAEHMAIAIELERGEKIEVRVYMAVLDGPKIDVFWMTDEAYGDYAGDREFDTYVNYNVIGTRNVDKTFEWDGEGTYFLVFDNTFSETPPPADPEYSNATIHYVVTWEEVEYDTTLRDFAVYTAIGIIAVFAAFLVIRYVTRKKER
jgi:hypothetical protein